MNTRPPHPDPPTWGENVNVKNMFTCCGCQRSVHPTARNTVTLSGFFKSTDGKALFEVFRADYFADIYFEGLQARSVIELLYCPNDCKN